MHILCNQRKKLNEDTLFFGYGKKNFTLKASYLYSLFLISQY